MTYKTGKWKQNDQAIELELSRALKSGMSSLTVQLGILNSHFLLKHTYRLTVASLLRLSFEASTSSGMELSVGMDKSVVSARNKVGLCVGAGTAGVSLRLRWVAQPAPTSHF